jgi:hypothetical protein
VRRPVSLVVVLGLAFTATLLPLLAVAAVLLSLVLPGRWRVLRLLGFALVYLLVETVGWQSLSCCGWRPASDAGCAPSGPCGPTTRSCGSCSWRVVGSARLLFGLRVVDDEVGWSPLDDGVPGSPTPCSSCRATPAGRLAAARPHAARARPRPAAAHRLKDLLQLDPLVDVYLNRLPERLPAGPGAATAPPGSAQLATGSATRTRC